MICANCRKRLRETDFTGESALYSPKRSFTLCEECFLAEDDFITESGTNNHPERIALYEANLNPFSAAPVKR